MKLNLGSKDVRHDGYLNLDIRKADGVDLVDNVMTLETIEPGSVDAIIAHNILEHVSPDRANATLRLWVSKLRRGGKISIGVPDGELIFNHYLSGKGNWEDVIHDIFGNIGLLRMWHGDDTEKYGHHSIYCKSYMRAMMEFAGLAFMEDEKPNHGAGFTILGFKI